MKTRGRPLFWGCKHQQIVGLQVWVIQKRLFIKRIDYTTLWTNTKIPPYYKYLDRYLWICHPWQNITHKVD